MRVLVVRSAGLNVSSLEVVVRKCIRRDRSPRRACPRLAVRKNPACGWRTNERMHARRGYWAARLSEAKRGPWPLPSVTQLPALHDA
jgi:hypothetical protein